MKKILFALAMVMSAAVGMAQSYDQLRNIISDKVIATDTSRIANTICFNELKVSINRSTEYGEWIETKHGNWLLDLNGTQKEFITHHSTTETIQIPKVIYDEYILGKQLSKAGVPIISIGLPICIIGTIFACNTEPTKQAAGVALLGVGSSLVSISIPLLCFGDHLKRTANKDYILYTYF